MDEIKKIDLELMGEYQRRIFELSEKFGLDFTLKSQGIQHNRLYDDFFLNFLG